MVNKDKYLGRGVSLSYLGILLRLHHSQWLLYPRLESGLQPVIERSMVAPSIYLVSQILTTLRLNHPSCYSLTALNGIDDEGHMVF